MNCVSTVEFAVLLDGRPGHWFTPSRGIRQGDSLSPYLFLLVSDVLSQLIQCSVDGGLINGVRMNHTCSTTSHLFFVDDTLIFLEANRQNCENIMHILNKYCLASGQQVSLHKSSVYFDRNIPPQWQTQLSSIMGMPSVSDPGDYLGLPVIWGRSKRQNLAYVKGRVIGKIQGWKQSSLSLAGK